MTDDEKKLLVLLLWDVAAETIDFNTHKRFLIERVMRFGKVAQVKCMRRTYTDTELIDVVKSSYNLDRKTATYWQLHFSIPMSEVRCLNTPPITPHFS